MIENRNGVLCKINLSERLSNSKPLVLEMGCGLIKRVNSAIGIDALNYPEVDIVGDIYDALKLFPDASVDAVFSYHFIEHVADVNILISELSRIVKPKGTVEFVAPHFSNPYFYSDPTHRAFFGLYTFCYLSSESIFARKVPTYQIDIFFGIVEVELIFKSPKPFYGRYAIKKLFGKLFNSCRYMKELYEENFCYIFPCYEVRYLLRRVELTRELV